MTITSTGRRSRTPDDSSAPRIRLDGGTARVSGPRYLRRPGTATARAGDPRMDRPVAMLEGLFTAWMPRGGE
jgi:hypothetical protein